VSFGKKDTLGRGVGHGAGKKLELRLSFSYFGLERGFPGSSGLGEPNGGGQGRTPRRRAGSAKERGVRGCRPVGNGTGQGGSISEHRMASVMSSLSAWCPIFPDHASAMSKRPN